MEKYLHEDFLELYHYCWNKEDTFKLLKYGIEIENFSEKPPRQLSKIFLQKPLYLICTAYAQSIDKKVREKFKTDVTSTHDQKINRSNSIA